MPTYIYEFEDGQRVERVQSIHEDALTEIDGRPVQRVITGGRRPITSRAAQGFRPFRSVRQMEYDPYAPHHGPEGEAEFHTKRELDEYVAKVNADPNRENIVWDG